VDSITGLDNRAGIFPIHRSVRFALLTCTRGGTTDSFLCRFGLSRADELDEGSGRARPAPIVLSRHLLARLSGEDDLGIPEIASEIDLRIVERLSTLVPRLGSERGWHVRFSRELNATDDRGGFRAFSGRPDARPVVEGKQLDSFRVALDTCRFELAPGAARSARTTPVARVAYRDVASATNRLTLIAAIVPAHAVTTHTVFCLKTPLDDDAQSVLCALLNSFVANYLVRMRVTTHVTISLVSRLPVPVVRAGHPAFKRLSSLARTLAGSTRPVEGMPEYAQLQALAARLYGLAEEEFAHVLGTFPLVKEDVRKRSLALFTTGEQAGHRLGDTGHRGTEAQR
jgi:hypothetical protein